MSVWKDKTDFEINKLVGECLGLDLSGITEEINLMYDSVKDYCNEPSRAWPIIELIFSKGVTLIINDTGVTTGNLGEDLNGESLDVDCKPLRAAMIVYLEINGVKP